MTCAEMKDFQSRLSILTPAHLRDCADVLGRYFRAELEADAAERLALIEAEIARRPSVKAG